MLGSSLTLPAGPYVEILGRGDPVVMLHGWSMQGALMRQLAEALSVRYQVFLVDLPGHGFSRDVIPFSMPSVLKEIRSIVPQRAHWVGWSLGGLLATAMAIASPSAVISLSLIAASPCFIERPGWSGQSPELLMRMSQDLKEHHEATLRRFISLQTLGLDNARELTHSILSLISAAPKARLSALEGGLSLLMHTDLRASLALLCQPMLVVLGGRDRLVPISISDQIHELRRDVVIQRINQAAHVPFLTHAEEVERVLMSFLASA